MPEREPATAVVLGAARDCLRHWPTVLLWLGVVPFGWWGIAALLPTPNVPGVFHDLALVLWASLVLPLEITIALDVLRKHPARWSALPRVLRRVPRVSAAYLLLTIPYVVGRTCVDVAQLEALRSYSDVLMAVGVTGMVGSAIACLRWIAWIPTIVDKDLRLLAALRVARQVARGRGAWVLRVGLWLVPPVLVAVGLTVRFPRFGHFSWALVVPWMKVVWVAAYLQLLQGSDPGGLLDSEGSGTDASLDPANQ